MRGHRVVGGILVGMLPALAAEPTPEQKAPVKHWSSETELSFVATNGNSNTETLGFKETLRRKWTNSQFQLKVEGLRSATSDDWFQRVDPGFVWEPGETPAGLTSTLVKPDAEPDAENYFAEGRYDRTIRKSLDWHAGLSWDRNEDAGIRNRIIAFGGVGNRWRDREDLKFHTSYGLSYTDREEETPDPEKDEQFAGVRLSWDYMNRFGSHTTYNHDWTVNVSLKDTGD